MDKFELGRVQIKFALEFEADNLQLFVLLDGQIFVWKLNFLNVGLCSSTISLPAFSKWGGQIGHTIKLKFRSVAGG